MYRYTITATKRIAAPAELVYEIIADYRNGHPQILPTKYFKSLEVESGGRGAGTIIRFEMRVLGRTQNFRSAILEPRPGRELVEKSLSSQTVTSFEVIPRGNGQISDVHIRTESTARTGIAGILESVFSRILLRRIYARELNRLAEIAHSHPPLIQIHSCETEG
jgi:Polyketide cyclase / dehydrase and lipid transport